MMKFTPGKVYSHEGELYLATMINRNYGMLFSLENGNRWQDTPYPIFDSGSNGYMRDLYFLVPDKVFKEVGRLNFKEQLQWQISIQ